MTIKDLPPGVQAAIEFMYHMSQQLLDGRYCSEEWPEAYDALRIIETQCGKHSNFTWDGDE